MVSPPCLLVAHSVSQAFSFGIALVRFPAFCLAARPGGLIDSALRGMELIHLATVKSADDREG